jgi:hypothetical protein
MAGHSPFCLKIGPGIRALTGAHIEKVEPPNMSSAEELWDRLIEAKSHRSIMECSTRNSPATRRMGLVCYHAYSIVGLAELNNGTRLLKIRNTWGHGEWEGKWRDDDDRWTDSVKRQVDMFQDSDDGSFYIEIDDFSIHYNRLYFATFDQDQKKQQQFSLTQKGYWLSPFAGGITTKNPQFYVAFGQGTDNKELEITLKIPQSQFSTDINSHKLVLLVCGIDNNQKRIRRLQHLENIIKQSHEAVARQTTRKVFLILPLLYTKLNDFAQPFFSLFCTFVYLVSVVLRLQAHVRGIIVIPCWDNGNGGNHSEGSFKLTVASNVDFGVEPLESKDGRKRGSARTIDQDLGRANLVPAELTGGSSTFESLTNAVSEKVQESCSIS